MHTKIFFYANLYFCSVEKLCWQNREKCGCYNTGEHFSCKNIKQKSIGLSGNHAKKQAKERVVVLCVTLLDEFFLLFLCCTAGGGGGGDDDVLWSSLWMMMFCYY